MAAMTSFHTESAAPWRVNTKSLSTRTPMQLHMPVAFCSIFILVSFGLPLWRERHYANQIMSVLFGTSTAQCSQHIYMFMQ